MILDMQNFICTLYYTYNNCSSLNIPYVTFNDNYLFIIIAKRIQKQFVEK